MQIGILLHILRILHAALYTMIMIKIRVMPVLIYYLNNISLALQPNLLTEHEELRKKINKMFNGKHGK